MRHYVKLIFIVLILLDVSHFVMSQTNQLVLHNTMTRELVGNECFYFKDTKGEFGIDEMIALPDEKFTQSPGNVLNFGISKSTYWLKLNVINDAVEIDHLLELAYPILDEIVFYEVKQGVVTRTLKAGKLTPDRPSSYDHPHFVFPTELDKEEQATYFIKAKTTEPLILPLYITTPTSFTGFIARQNIISGMFIGVILIMIFYNLFIFYTVRDTSYIYYVLYILFVGFTQVSIKGYTGFYLWPDAGWFQSHSSTLFSSLGGIFALGFAKKILNTKAFLKPVFHHVLTLFILLFCISIICSLLGLKHEGFTLMHTTTSVLSLYVLIVSYYIYYKGFHTARFFVLGWTILLIGALVFQLKDYNILPYNQWTTSSMQVASAIEMALLSFALADRINVLKKEKEISQLEALRISKENERIITQQNIVLEQKVQERTIKLKESNEELNKTIEELKETQSQLVDSEKMASIGQLTAGIAHEINNPINFVTSNVKPLRMDIKDILDVINLYGKVGANEKKEEIMSQLKEVEAYKNKIDIDFVIEEVNMLIDGIDEGAQRTAEIIRSLRNFSRLDEDDLKFADINEGLVSTITILNNRIKNNVTINKSFGSIPEIECYPGKLNQLFMNIITNGLDAVKEKHGDDPEKAILNISTQLVENEIEVRIEDNGSGIPDAVKNKIFDPFFTTKDVGHGTGLGLSIVHKIIKKHNAKIEVNTKEGEGTAFIIHLPLVGNKNNWE